MSTTFYDFFYFRFYDTINNYNKNDLIVSTNTALVNGWKKFIDQVNFNRDKSNF